MKNFMIGMHGKYDENKYNRDFREDFYGIEACLFKDEMEVDKLLSEVGSSDIQFGVHFPLRAGLSKLRDPQFLSVDEDIMSNAYKYMEDELSYINSLSIKPQYILFHYPKPVILKSDFDMTNWRFADNSEYTYEADYPMEEFKKYSEKLFAWLSEKGTEYGFIPVLEFDALNKYVCGDRFLESLLEKYPAVKLCLDTGRLHLQSSIDSEFDAIDIIKTFAKYTEVVHLWNVKVAGNLENSHYPALPSLKKEEGWGAIEEYLKIIAQENANVRIMFEHRSDLISDEELENCYAWVSSIMIENCLKRQGISESRK